MKKLLALVLSLVMALSLIPTVWGTELDDVFAQLREAGYNAPEAEPRMWFPDELERGVDYDCIYEYDEACKDTVLTIVLKKGSEDHWKKAYENRRNSRGNLTMDLFMPEPDQATTARVTRPLDGNITDGRVLNFISGVDMGYMYFVPTTPATEIDIAAFNESAGFVTVTPVATNTDMYYIMVYDEDQIESNGNETKWMIRYRVVKEEDFSHKLDYRPVYPVDADRIDAANIDFSRWEVDTSQGKLTVRSLDPMVTTWQPVGEYMVTAPDGYTTVDGYLGTGDGFGGPGTTTLTFTWVDQDQNERLEKLTIEVQPCYPLLRDLGFVPAAGVEMPTLTSGGVQVRYNEENGVYYTSFSNSVMPFADELNATIKIPVPAGAKSYRYLPKRTAESPFESYDEYYLDALLQAKIRPVSDTEGYTMPIANVDKVVLRDDRMTLYFAFSQDYNIRLLQWYADEAGEEPMGAPMYVIGYNGPLAWFTATEAVTEVTQPVSEPTLIGQTGLTLVSTRYPQECGGNTLYIELSVSGNVGDGSVVYLPYSYFDGLTYELAVERNLPDPVIHHYNEACSEYTDIQGEYTEYGIKFTTPSFSPFTITCAPLWGDINGDGATPDITDVECLYEHLTTGGRTNWTGKMLAAAMDVNDDGQADVYDLQLLYEIVSGVELDW